MVSMAICVYSVTEKNLKGNETFGMFYYAEIKLLDPVKKL